VRGFLIELQPITDSMNALGMGQTAAQFQQLPFGPNGTPPPPPMNVPVQ
jgi:hypothetical protein